MDEIVDKLSEIELVSNKILESTVSRKKELYAEVTKKMQDFDAEIDEDTKIKLEELKNHLDLKMKEELFHLREKNDAQLDSLKAEYNNNHAHLAKELLNKIIGD